jgi:NAD(P)-dependent dehydrogenase (short-subunit alcohol dehydrogenase family)
MNRKNQVVLVTGAANGIGKEIATQYALKGATVVLTDIEEEAGKEVEANLREKGYEVLFIGADLSKEEDCLHVIEVIRHRWHNLNILINNAGVSTFTPLFEMETTEWDRIINTNLRSVFILSREGAKIMNETGGAIINIASTRATQSEPNSEAYAASKGGILALTHALSASLAKKGIRVNSISPGWIQTDNYSALREVDHTQHFSGRVGKPIDIAKACLFLSDPDNDFINGENIVIDGGMTRKMIYED